MIRGLASGVVSVSYEKNEMRVLPYVATRKKLHSYKEVQNEGTNSRGTRDKASIKKNRT